VAVVTIDAVVHVSVNALVRTIHLWLQMAVGALEHRVIVWVRMTGGANAIGVTMIHREPGVIELGVSPNLRVVARRTGGREVRTGMVRIIGVVVIRRMTAVTIGR
jgi:hypothetical protein